MLILPIEEAKSGMALAAPVSHPEHPEQDLLKAGYILEAEVLKRMRDMGVIQVYVDFPGLDDLDRHLAVNLSPERQKLYTQIKETIVNGQKRTRPSVSYTDYYATTRELIITLMSQGQHPIYIEHMSSMGGDAVIHATSVSHLGLMLGIKLETYLIQQRKRLAPQHAKEVVNIGVAGMLHDMGKLSLPPELQKFNGVNLPEDPEKLREWQEHCEKSYEMIKGGVEPSAAAAVMHHHQRWDGGGYPITKYADGTTSCLQTARIHIFARIVATANLYDRLATPLNTKARRSNLEILHLMRTQYASWCDPTVVKALQAITPPFPPGAIVGLSDNTSAVVVDVDSANPYRPIVRRIIGDDMQLEEGKSDLRKPAMPSVVRIGKTPVDGMIPDNALATTAA